MTFQIHPLSYETFAPLFAMSDADLAANGACRRTVTATSGAPCRVSLTDAEPGETVILANHVHLPETSPYRAAHAVYVRQHARPLHPAPGELPPVMRDRLLSIRGYDAAHMMQAAQVVAGAGAAEAIDAVLDDPSIAYVHVHYAAAGCFAARVTRA